MIVPRIPRIMSCLPIGDRKNHTIAHTPTVTKNTEINLLIYSTIFLLSL